MSSVTNIVGNNIRRVRTARNMTQSDLGDLLGLNQRTISNWEKGLPDPGTENLRSLADALDITPTELIGHNSAPADTTFQFIVKGDDMSPEIQSGDTLMVSRSKEKKDGDLVIVRIGDAEYCRRMFSHDGLMTLIALDPKIGMQIYDNSEVAVLGKVIEIKRKLT